LAWLLLGQSRSRKRNGGKLGPSDNFGESKNINLFRVCGYAHAGTFWQGQHPLLMLRTMMTSATPGAADQVAEDGAKADNLHQAHGQVWTGTKESRSSSFEDSTKDTQH
jgi:hypothetical protein